jgi:beta-lactam-binding protein with PASTA domain
VEPRRPRAGTRRRRALAAGLAVVAAAGLAVAVVGGPAGARTVGWVTVPRVAGTADVTVAYARLRRAGLRTAIPRPFAIGSLCRPSARSQSPAPGARVPAGTTVVLRRLRCPLGSPAGGYEQALVPNVTGATASTAVRRAEAAGLYWQLSRLPPLRPSRRRSLLDNYVVTAQSPAAGTVLARGVDCSTYASSCYRPTPLRLATRVRRG